MTKPTKECDFLANSIQPARLRALIYRTVLLIVNVMRFRVSVVSSTQGRSLSKFEFWRSGNDSSCRISNTTGMTI